MYQLCIACRLPSSAISNAYPIPTSLFRNENFCLFVTLGIPTFYVAHLVGFTQFYLVREDDASVSALGSRDRYCSSEHTNNSRVKPTYMCEM